MHKYLLWWGMIGEFLYTLARSNKKASVLGGQEETCKPLG